MSSVPAAVYNVAELQKEFVELSEEFKDLEVRHLFFFSGSFTNQYRQWLNYFLLFAIVCESRILGVTRRLRGSSDEMYKKY